MTSEPAKNIKIFFSVVVLGLCFGFFFLAKEGQNKAVLAVKAEANALNVVNVDICSYRGTLVIEPCGFVKEGDGQILYKILLESESTRRPSKVVPASDYILRVFGHSIGGEKKCIGFNVLVFASLPDRIYFSPLSMDMECSQIIKREVGLLMGRAQTGTPKISSASH